MVGQSCKPKVAVLALIVVAAILSGPKLRLGNP